MINARSEKKTFYIKISKIVLLSAAILLIYMYYYANCHSRMYLTIFGLIAIGVITLIALALFKRITLESTKLFAAVLLISGIFFTFAFTPGSVPDETFHYWSSYYYSDLILGGEVDYENTMLEAAN